MAMIRHHILVLGSGMVVQPVVDYLLREGASSPNHLTLASLFLREAVAAAKDHDPAHITTLEIDISRQTSELDSLVSQADIVVSLVPATMHVMVAKHCLKHKKHLLTASYISPAMTELDAAAKEADVLFLNELGLDPGIDHMSAMAIIDEAKAKGGKIRSFVSWCGALPAPDCNDNPLGYKFSWSPRGVLSSASLTSSFLWGGAIAQLEPDHRWTRLLPVHVQSSSPHVQSSSSVDAQHELVFEGVANRDSLSYIDVYGLSRADLHTMFRGTLRWPGFGTLVRTFLALGLFDAAPHPSFHADAAPTSWRSALASLVRAQSKPTGSDSKPASDLELEIRDLLTRAFSEAASHTTDIDAQLHVLPRDVARDVDDAVRGLEWLGLTGSEDVARRGTPIDSLCTLLEKKLSYAQGERDIVVMQHEFIIEYTSHSEKHFSTLIVYGETQSESQSQSQQQQQHESRARQLLHAATGTALTVGLPAAIAAELVLSGRVARRGVAAPIYEDIYKPILSTLRSQGIDMVERVEKL